ncbi:hypothetical protein AK812_SmicGene16060 [Symbiodinium microadriaticum]|uniref:Uncharacterized protein n=1 Tax=Symbiodinium microadriaticum TaxID=2951 RepID=A0A1Q9E1C3_SYMMI|nr:hypothetical protein AK812_SmicGene16060 [Symbiodinium microadriaticum]
MVFIRYVSSHLQAAPKLCAIIDKHIDEPESFPVRHEVPASLWQTSWAAPFPATPGAFSLAEHREWIVL